MMNYGYQQYKTQAVETMTKGEMLILLYDEINKRLLRARAYFEKEDIALFEADIQRAIDIVNYLEKSLDRKYPISNDLYRLYDFITYELTRVKTGRNLELIDDITPLIKDLRESFKEADRLSKKDPSVGAGIGTTTSSVTLGVG
ncbi:flagellar export chaperone FliS [Aminipila luticellarii]|uniref:Flagellar export chaperone FliS n=1 Tax=Aminipila luticellarii TaxID=2507160 RepID=A0A410PT08_9FIRM|nr:flagellar export chaperone FliS [Aminipila luticellarii]QAT42040.1 flagellar export chaperone FliS [Aminipila luticellarii]